MVSKMARRKGKKKELNNKILIVCQGITEYNYFEKFRVDLAEVSVAKCDTGCAKIVSKKCTESPKRVVEYAIKISKDTKYRMIWCVFDKDTFPDFEEAISLAKKNGISCAFSNKDFELWFLMHLKKQHTHISDDECKKKLGEYLNKKYEKTDPELYNRFKSKMDIAINNSKIVHQSWRKAGVVQYDKMVPCTNVYALVEELLSWRKK
ncbi:RloB domain-containing protein [Clostridium perfringens]|nr:RloB domain-containing protein [Clostridium perfringens]